MNNLAVMLGSRFERMGDIDDLQRAIMLANEAIALPPQDHPNRATSMYT
jgi:hypothetical protein